MHGVTVFLSNPKDPPYSIPHQKRKLELLRRQSYAKYLDLSMDFEMQNLVFMLHVPKMKDKSVNVLGLLVNQIKALSRI